MRIAILLILSMSQAQDWFPLATSLAGERHPLFFSISQPRRISRIGSPVPRGVIRTAPHLLTSDGGGNRNRLIIRKLKDPDIMPFGHNSDIMAQTPEAF